MNKLLLSLTLISFTCALFGQSQNVQTFTYESTTRDTLIQFPEGDHNRYKQILMHYSMRCKDALVSTGSDRNLGCGEWDYSCNTYIVDSTRVDSVKASSPEYEMPGFGDDVFSYTDRPSYTFRQSTYKNVSIDDALREKEFEVYTAESSLDNSNWMSPNGTRMMYIIPASWFEDKDIDRLSSLKIPVSQEVNFKRVVINMAESNVSHIDEVFGNGDVEWMNVYRSDTRLSPTDNTVYFHSAFREIDGDVLVSISFDSADADWAVEGQESSRDSAIILMDNESQYVRFGNRSHMVMANDIPEIENEISISFWQKGSDNLPANSTLLEAVDNSDNRQINIHLPWGNGQIYWDCGNDGSGYDRINKSANPEDFRGVWNHWAFTKNAATGEMHIYLNGALWHSGTERFKPIDVQRMNIGSNIVNSLSHFGDVDELRIWNKALDQETIRSYMHRSIDNTHPEYASLVLYYNFNGMSGDEVQDASPYLNNASLSGSPVFVNWRSDDLFMDGSSSTIIPAHSLVDGIYISSVEDSLVLDSIPNLPQLVNHYVLNGTDLELDWSDLYYQSGDQPITNDEGEIVGSINYPETGVFERGELLYYNKTPMAFEIMSFVTPYGIGIDFGEEGHTWTFDVTDYGPILKGQKRLFMSRGGQWQEEMDIRFEFIEGVPDRDVIDIQQIWKVDQVAFGSILNDWRFEPRQFVYDPSVSSYIIQTAITGHGQQGEFIPRSHTIDVDGFVDTWTVWKECAENPVYPQGGTWVYDRAGWCPGMATDIRRYDVSPYFQFAQTPTVDYTVQTASGDSRYIVSSQLIQYGPPNKAYDVAITDAVNPSMKIEHGRYNPTCHAPVITVRNKGENTINNLLIKYGVEGKLESEYEWTGSLPFNISWQITLPYNDEFHRIMRDGDEFFIEVELPGQIDEDLENNRYSVEMVKPDHYSNHLIIEWRTNFTPQETSYRLTNGDGDLIFSKSGSVLSNNTTYRDTVFNLDGCYKLRINDSDQDGISWWANNDGNGYIRVKEEDGDWKVIATDFGAFIEYNFTAGMITSTVDLTQDYSVFVYPNPSHSDIYFSDLSHWDENIKLELYDQLGRMIWSGNKFKSELNGRPLNFLSELESGSYIIKLRDSKKRAAVKFVRI